MHGIIPVDMRGDHYVYIVFRPDGSPCYVGKGKGYRWRFHLWRSHNRQLRGIVERAGGEVPIVIVRSGIAEADAYAMEAAFISAIGRFPIGPLVNMTDGGEGMLGHKQSPETIERRISKTRGRIPSQETRDKISAAKRGMIVSEETRAKLRRPKSEAHRLALRMAKLGRKQSAAFIETRIAPLRGRQRPPEVGAKVSASKLAASRARIGCAPTKQGNPPP